MPTHTMLTVQRWGWFVWSLPFYACWAPSQWQCVVYELKTSCSSRLSISCLLIGTMPSVPCSSPMGEETHFQGKRPTKRSNRQTRRGGSGWRAGSMLSHHLAANPLGEDRVAIILLRDPPLAVIIYYSCHLHLDPAEVDADRREGWPKRGREKRLHCGPGAQGSI